MHAYTVRVSREGKWWMVAVPEIDGLTQARRLGEVEEMARSLIAITKDVAEESFDLRVELEAIEDLRVTEMLDALNSSRAELEQAQATYSERLRSAAWKLSQQGVTVRDIGTALGVSFQRAQQLISS